MNINIHAQINTTKINDNWYINSNHLVDIINQFKLLDCVTDLTYPEIINLDVFWQNVAEVSNIKPFKITKFKHKHGGYKLNKLSRKLSSAVINNVEGLWILLDVAINVIGCTSDNLELALLNYINSLSNIDNKPIINKLVLEPIILIDIDNFQQQMDMNMNKIGCVNYLNSIVDTTLCYVD